MGISVVLLAANEAENLKVLLPRIISQLCLIGTEYEILVIDSAATTDDTPAVCAFYPCVRYMNQEEPCYAGAFRTGIRQAREESLLVLDADGSHPPEMIKVLYERFSEGYDMVIGSRYCKGGQTMDSKRSILMSKLLNFVMRMIVGVKAKDISTSFRFYRTQQIKSVALTCMNYEVLQEVILRMKKRKPDFSISEVPITFEKRIFGESKRHLLRFILTYLKTLFIFLRIRFDRA
jgi:dolichol-phosphate mannosyltransferase